MPSRYEAAVDPAATNSAHAFMAQMVGGNKRILELGAASGHMTRVLCALGCTVTAVELDPEAARDLKGQAAEVIVGDLNSATLLDDLRPEFDVVLAGDVLEHLLDPQAVLDRVTRLLAPGGRVVVSLPHVGHVDVRLALLQGRWDYHPYGLLDDTHIRFFTLKTIKELVTRSGLVITDLRRVRIPAFESELQVDRGSVATEVLNAALQDPEAETYQFVFTAVKDDGDYQMAQLANRHVELKAELERARIREAAARADEGAARADEAAARADEGAARALVAAAEREADRLRVERDRLVRDIEVLRATKTFRYTHALRACYGRVRRPGS